MTNKSCESFIPPDTTLPTGQERRLFGPLGPALRVTPAGLERLGVVVYCVFKRVQLIYIYINKYQLISINTN